MVPPECHQASVAGDLPCPDMHGAAAPPVDELIGLYVHLRRELDKAYANRPLDSVCLDGLAQDLLRLERTMVRRGVLDAAVEGLGLVASRDVGAR